MIIIFLATCLFSITIEKDTKKGKDIISYFSHKQSIYSLAQLKYQFLGYSTLST